MSFRTVAGTLVVDRTPRGWEFRPTPFIARIHLFAYLLTGAVFLVIGGLFWRLGGHVTAVILGLPILCFVVVVVMHAVSSWRQRSTPLTIDDCGRVTYGDQELCAPNSVAAIQIIPDPLSDADGHKVRLELNSGVLVEMPAPYFQSFNREQARSLAAEFAVALHLETADSP